MTYGYGGSGLKGATNDLLTSVSYNTSPTTSQTYKYELTTTQPLLLTGIVDENGHRVSTWAYDTIGRATSSERFKDATNAIEVTTVAYNDSTGTRTVTNPLGQQYTYTYTVDHGLPKISQIDRAASTGVPAVSRTFGYDANGFQNVSNDWNGNSTHATNNAQGLPTAITEAFGTPIARTTNITYDNVFTHLPAAITQPTQSSTRATNFVYDGNGGSCATGASGDTCSITFTDNATSTSRAWNYTWDSTGELLTAQDPRSHTTTLTYSSGNLATVTDALSHVTNFTSYDSDGRLKVFTDPNGLTTTLGYDKRGQLTSRAVGSETTTLTRDATETVTGITNPDSSVLTLGRDYAHRLTSITNSLGEKIAYTLDGAGNRAAVQVYDTTSTLNRSGTATYDALSRPKTSVDAYSNTTSYGYDSNSNLTRVTDPLSNQAQYAYDQLNRVKTVTDPLLNATNITYSADIFNLVSQAVTQRGVTTQYTYDGFGELKQISSQDSGLTNYTYDAGGNVATRLDANANLTTNTWDNLNRLTNAAYSNGGTGLGNDGYTWDTATNGIGRLASATGRMGETTNYSYDLRGRVTQEQQVQGTRTFNASYGFDAFGRLSTMTYPSGLALGYSYDAAGQINQLNANASTFLSSITHQPFGEVKAWTWGAAGTGTSYARTFDNDGRLATYPLVTDTRTVNYDNASRVKTVVDSVGTQTFGYDADSHVNSYSAPGSISQSYTYDNDGNRLTKVITGTGTTSYSVTLTSNILQSRTEPGPSTVTYTPNADGTTASEGTYTFSYDVRGLMVTMAIPSLSQSTSYTIDAFGKRVAKAGTGGTWFNVFDRNGDNIGDYSTASSGSTAVPLNETIRFEGLPVAVALDGPLDTSSTLFRIYAGHLAEPRTITNASQQLRWTWSMSDAFGNTAANDNASGLGAFTYNLRWPGQTYDAESGNSYNMNRDYEPVSGRYLQSDPLGLRGGTNTFAYVGGDVANFVDRKGLQELEWLAENPYVDDGLSKIEELIDTLSDYAAEYGAEVGGQIREIGQSGWGKLCLLADKINTNPALSSAYGAGLGFVDESEAPELYGEAANSTAYIFYRSSQLGKMGLDEGPKMSYPEPQRPLMSYPSSQVPRTLKK
jgi:RHS repeat-associated protein